MANAALKTASENAFTTTYTPRGTKKEVTLPGINAFSGDILGLPANDTAVKAPETDHARVFRLVAEKKYEAAAFLAARLINSGQVEGFFIYGTGNSARTAQNWFDDQVSTSRKTAFAVVKNLTPEIAQIVLKNNAGNRRVDPGNLAKLMRDLSSTNWKFNGESIIIARTGKTNDGQHRCFAVLLTGIPAKTTLTFGPSEDSMPTIDIGKKRTGSDRLGLEGESDTTVASAVSSLLFELESGHPGTAVEIDAYYFEHRTDIKAAIKAKGKNIRGIGPTASAVAALHLIRKGYGADKVKEFFAVVRDNQNTRNGNSARTLHLALFPTAAKQDPLRLKRDEWVATLCKHFENWVRGVRTPEPLLPASAKKGD